MRRSLASFWLRHKERQGADARGSPAFTPGECPGQTHAASPAAVHAGWGKPDFHHLAFNDSSWPSSDARDSRLTVNCAHIANVQRADPTVRNAVSADFGQRPSSVPFWPPGDFASVAPATRNLVTGAKAPPTNRI